MDPVVTGAAIGLSGAIIGAIGGYLGSVRTSNKTIEHDREQRVWERRADAYLESLAAVEYLQITRGVVDDWDPPMLEDFLRTHDTPDWEMLDARMLAFASEPVWERMQAVSRTYKVLPALHLQASTPEPTHPKAAKAAARLASEGLIDLIRTELQSGERQQTPSQRLSSRGRQQRLPLELEAIELANRPPSSD
jgi:hypothetical protein